MDSRIEKDSLGEVLVPKSALYGAQTVRALENFKITGQKVSDMMFLSLATVKKACAIANYKVGQLSDDVYGAIVMSCDEILMGLHKDQFLTDAIQGGAGTSMNMNINEIIANRAAQILGLPIGVYDKVHPNDHVNKAQSTNDVIPTAGKLTTIRLVYLLIEQMELLMEAFDKKAEKYKDVIKVGRTHLQDAVLISMGQVFHSYSTLIKRDIRRIQLTLNDMYYINLGATAVGTGINSVNGYKELAVEALCKVSNEPFFAADDLIDATKHVDGFAFVHSELKTFSLGLSRICNDIRMMASGPKSGFGEIILPDKQPGSSIMPGKVNPVIPEVVNQICFQVIGNDLTVTMAAEAGQMELNVFEPVLFRNLFESLELLIRGCQTLRELAIDGLIVNEARINEHVNKSLAVSTSLVKYLGYTKVSEITKKALKENKSIKEVVLEEGLLSIDELDEILNPMEMIHPR